MHLVEKNIWIDRPPEDVFAFHANHANRAAWHEHVTRSVMLTPEPLGLGSRFAVDTISAGRLVPMTIAIIAYEPYRYYAYRSTAAQAISDSHQTFTAENGGTRFHVRIELNFRGLAKPFGWFILKFGLERHFAAALNELKEEMEKN